MMRRLGAHWIVFLTVHHALCFVLVEHSVYHEPISVLINIYINIYIYIQAVLDSETLYFLHFYF